MRTKKIISAKYIVLLIGVSTFTKSRLGDIPNVKTNILELQKLFLNSDFIGVKPENIMVSLNENHDEIYRKISDAAKRAKNSDYTLFVYYSGHGVISTSNYQLYFASADIQEDYLDVYGINAKMLLEKINKSQASRKILLVDACHSGQIHNTMGDVKSNVASLMKNYEGVQYITACDEYSCALFPKKKPNVPTYFTGAILSRIQKGMSVNRPYLTLRDIVEDIAVDFKERTNMPLPQISSVQSVDKMPFAYNVINKDFSDFDDSISSKKSTNNVETEWEKTVKANTLVAYYDYMEKYHKSKYAKQAENKVLELEEEEKWQKTINLGTLLAYDSYKKAYPAGKYISKANLKIAELQNINKDNDMWTMVCGLNTVEKYKEYLKCYPKGCHVDEAEKKIKILLSDKIFKRNILIILFSLTVGFVLFYFLRPDFGNSSAITNISTDTRDSITQSSADSSSISKVVQTPVSYQEDKTIKQNNTTPRRGNTLTNEEKLSQADFWMKEQDEMYYKTCLTYYQDVYQDTHNMVVFEKIQEVKRIIEKTYELHIENAMIFYYADNGIEDALDEFKAAARMHDLNSEDQKVYDELIKKSDK